MPRTLICLFLVALAARVLFAVTRSPEIVWPDSEDYHSIAENVLDGKGFVEAGGRRGSRAPGYPVFLAGCYAVGLRDPRAVYVIQAVAGAAMCVLVVLLGRRLFGRDSRASVYAGWMAAVYPFFVYFTGLMLAETLFVLGFVAYLGLVTCGDGNTSTAGSDRFGLSYIRFVGAGVLAGVLVLLRSSFLLFPVFMLPFWLWHTKRYGKALRRWAVMIAVMIAVMLPWVVRNYRIYGHIIPTTLQVGESLYEANSPHADGGPAMHRIDWVKERGGVNMDEYENNRFFKNAALQFIRSNPRQFVWLAFEKLRRFWNIVPNYSPYRSPFYATISVCSYLPILLLAILGLAWSRSRGSATLILMAPVLYFSMLHMVFVGSIRYRMPVMPFVILLAGLGAEAVRRRWLDSVEGAKGFQGDAEAPKRRRRWLLRVVIGIFVVVAIFVFVWRHFVTPEKLRLAAQDRLSTLAGVPVDVREIEFGFFKGVVLRGVRVEDKRPEVDRPALRVDTVVLQPSWSSLLRGDMVLVGMRLEDVQVDATLDEFGNWPFLEQLQLSEEGEGRLPAVFISRTRVKVSGLDRCFGMSSIDLARLNATIRPVLEGGEFYDAVLWSDELKLGRPRVSARFSVESRTIHGTLRFANLDLTSQLLNDLLPVDARNTWDEFAPTKGNLTTQTEFSWDPARAKKLEVKGDAYLRDLSFKHKRFPHAIERVSVDISFDERSFRVGRFKGMVGKTEVSGGGVGELMPSGVPVWEATIRAKGIGLDDDLYALLPELARSFWDRIHPAGTINFSVSMNSDPERVEPELRAQVELLDCACQFAALPVGFTNIRGRLHIDGRRLAMRGIKGLAGGAPFSLRDGFVILDHDAPFLVGGEVQKLQLGGPCGELFPAKLLDKAPAIVQQAFADGKIAGEWGGSVNFRRDTLGGPITSGGTLVLTGGSFSHPELALPVSDVHVKAQYEEGLIQLDGLSAAWGEGRIEVPATTLSVRPHGAQNLAINCLGLPIDAALYKVVPASVRRVWDQLNATGYTDIKLEYTRDAGEAASMHRKITATFKDGAIRYVGFPYSVSGISGRLLLDGRAFKHAELQGTRDGAAIKVGVYGEPVGDLMKTRIVVNGVGVPLDKELRDALPQQYHEWWDAFRPEGFVDLKYVRMHGVSGDGLVLPKYSCDVSADSLLLDARVPVNFAGVSLGIVQGKQFVTGPSMLNGKIYFDSAKFDRQVIEKFDGAIEGEGGGLFLDGVSADCYAGNLTGTASMLPSVAADGDKSTVFKVNLNLSDADAATAAQVNEIEGLSGRLNATTSLTFVVGKDASFRAAGALAIQDGQIGELPGMLSVLNLFRLRGLDAPAFHSVVLRYGIAEGIFNAYELNLLGKVLSLYGKGTVDRDKQMDFTFRMEVGPRVNIPGIMDLWDVLKEKAVPITVQGDLNDPVWRMNPLISVARIVQGTLGKLIPGKSSPQK